MNSLQTNNSGGSPTKFHLDKQGGKLMGVCAGLANYFKVDPMVVRLVFVAGFFLGFGSFALIYLGIGLLAD